MNNNSNGAKGGIGFIGLLTIAFIVLKLVGVISWSWVWVFAPLWGGAILGVLTFIVVALIIGKIFNS